MLEEQEKLTNDKHFFDEQRATLENERKQLTDAAIKLGHEVGIPNINLFVAEETTYSCDLFFRAVSRWIVDFE